MLFFDVHCDILSAIDKPEELFHNSCHWAADRALSNGPFIQVFSLFSQTGDAAVTKKGMEAQLENFLAAERSFPEKLKIIRNSMDLEQGVNRQERSRIYGLIEAEGAEILGGSLEELERLFESGLRILTLSWNYDNDVCDSIAEGKKNNGLSALGRQVVKRAQKLGILIDISHASDKTFEDVIAMSSMPITASHSNARAICRHRRNLTDAQIKALAEKGGIIGINLCPDFLNDSGNAQILDIIKHIEHISSLVGFAHVGFGCDFDGIDTLPHGISGVEDLGAVIEYLLRLNYSEAAVKAFAGDNFARLLMQVLPA